MIASLDQPINETSNLGNETVFTVEPPHNSPFTAQPSVSFKSTGNDTVQAKWEEERPSPPLELSDTVFQNIVFSTTRELSKRPRSSLAHSNLGIALLNEGRLEEAAGEFQAALQLNPHNYSAIAAMAKTLIIQGRLADARALYERLAALTPNHPGPFLGLANIASREGRLEDACSLVRQVIGINRKRALPHYHLGLLLLRMNRITAAIGELRTATHLEVRVPAFHHALGVAYALAQDNRKAARAFKSALTLAPDSPESARGLANVLLEEGNSEGVVTLLKRHLEINPRDTVARETLARAYSALDKQVSCRAQLMEVLSLQDNSTDIARDEDRARLLNNIGVSYMSERNYADAEKYFSKAMTLTKVENIPLHNLARVYVQTERTHKALVLLEYAKDKFHDEATALLMASVLGQEGEFAAGLRELVPFLNSGKAGPDIYGCAGYLVSDGERNFHEAKRILSEGLERFPNDKRIVNNLAYVLLMLDEAVAARTVLESLPRKSRLGVELTATWGLLHMREGDIATGARMYGEAYELASSQGNPELAKKAHQKMNLELARHFLRLNKPAEALHHVRVGLSRCPAKECFYTRDLRELRKQLEGEDGTV